MLARLKARVGGRKTSVAAHDRDSGSGSDESSDESSDDDDDGAANAAAAKRKEKKTAQQPADDSDDDGSSDDEGEFLSGRDAAANAVHNAVAVARAAADAAAAAAAAAQDAAIRPSLRPTIELLRADPTLKLGDRGFQQLVRAHPALYAVDKHHRPLPIAVDLTRSGLADCDVLDLASALAAPQGSPGSAAAGRITELWLSNGIGTRGDENNAVGDGGAVALARVLACGSVHGLRTLALVNLTIGCPGARALAAALRHNSALTTLYLGHNCIHDGGAEALAEALRENHGVKTLTLDHNAVTRRGVAQFNLSLQVNRTLTALDLTARRGRGAAPAEAELARLLGLPIDERTAGRARILAELAKVIILLVLSRFFCLLATHSSTRLRSHVSTCRPTRWGSTPRRLTKRWRAPTRRSARSCRACGRARRGTETRARRRWCSRARTSPRSSSWAAAATTASHRPQAAPAPPMRSRPREGRRRERRRARRSVARAATRRATTTTCATATRSVCAARWSPTRTAACSTCRPTGSAMGRRRRWPSSCALTGARSRPST
jgi:hypothetical protein